MVKLFYTATTTYYGYQWNVKKNYRKIVNE